MSPSSAIAVPRPALCLVTDLAVVGNDAARLAAAVTVAVANGVNIVQIRAPQLSPDAYAELAARVTRAVSTADARIIANPPSVRHLQRLLESEDAAASRRTIDGVHLAENARVGVAEVRARCGGNILVGQSAHSRDAAIRADGDGADYLILGTIYPSATHPGGVTHGAAFIRAVADAVAAPIVAIGGITAENAGEVMRNGASGVAVIRAVLGAGDVGAAARALSSALWRRE